MALLITPAPVNFLTATMRLWWLYLRLSGTDLPCVCEKNQPPVCLCNNEKVWLPQCVCVCSFSPKHIYKSHLNHMFENSFYLLYNCSSSSCLLHCHLIFLLPFPPSRLSHMTQCPGLFDSSLLANRISFKLPFILTRASTVVIILIYFPFDTHH